MQEQNNQQQSNQTQPENKKVKHPKVQKVLNVLKAGYKALMKIVDAINNVADFFDMFKRNKDE